MATNYTSLLGFALPQTGTLSGQWGTVVNENITELVEDSIAATATAAVTSGDWTLSTTGSGAANEARCAILIPTGTPGTTRNIIAPSQSKAYVVINQSDAAVVVKGSATTGVSIPAGSKGLVSWDGSDFVLIGAGSINDLPGTLNVAKGGTGATTLTANNVILGNGTSAVQFVAPGTNGNVLTSNGTTWTSATLAVNLNTPLSVVGNNTAGAEIRLPEDTDNGSNYVALKAADNITSNLTLTLPTEDGTNGQALVTNGSGVLSFADVATGPILENAQTISANYTVTAGKNAASVGPVTINTGISVTVGTGQRWLIFG